MSLIKNGCVLLSTLLTLALFDSGLAPAQEVKEIKLTEKHIQGFIAAHDDLMKLFDSSSPDNSDPKVEAQAEAIVRKNGFANLAEHDIVSINISMIMSGIDPQTKRFTEPPEQIRKEIAALKTAKPIQFKENVALVLKYYDKLAPMIQQG